MGDAQAHNLDPRDRCPSSFDVGGGGGMNGVKNKNKR